MERILNLINPDEFAHSFPDTRIPFLVQQKFLPEYFMSIPDRIQSLPILPIQPSRQQVVIAGGTDYYLQQGENVPDANVMLLNREVNFKGIYIENNQCVIRAATTITELETSEIIQHAWPDFKKYLQLISCPSIRNRATVGGNIINASPIGDLSIMLLALDATVVLKQDDQMRTVKLKDFFRGYKQLDKSPAELLHSIAFQIPPKSGRYNFEKVSRRTHLDIASVNSAILISMQNNFINEMHLAAGGVAPIPCYLAKASAFLINKALNPENVAATIDLALSEVTPITDVRGTAGYKKLLLKQLILAHFMTLFPEISEAENFQA
jgi:xanthine dehydrogenase small subunit